MSVQSEHGREGALTVRNGEETTNGLSVIAAERRPMEHVISLIRRPLQLEVQRHVARGPARLLLLHQFE